MRSALILTAFVCVIASCNEPKSSPPPAPATSTPASTATATSNATPSSASLGKAELGKPAPDFTLKDLDGKDTKLSSFKGKVVVLEWFNPGCPYVNAAHTKGSLKDAAQKHTKNGIVWLAVNSGGPGKQGAGVEANREGAKKFGLSHPILLDESGDVGHTYGATNTPHMFVVDSQGTLVYRGAIDNSPDGEGESAPDGKLVSYVDEAVAAIGAGKAPPTPETRAYGCTVKYSSKR